MLDWRNKIEKLWCAFYIQVAGSAIPDGTNVLYEPFRTPNRMA
jgi:hypothetical protein